MTSQRVKAPGFTLVELMITIAILGIIAALAVPAFTAYVARSKTAEVSANLNQMFKGAAAYYSGDSSAKGVGSTVTGYCTVGDATPKPATPGPKKQLFPNTDPSLRAIRFTISDYVYYSYGLTSADALGACRHVSNTGSLYTFVANGDLDGDSILSVFQLAAGSDPSNTLYHARGFYVRNEIE